MALTGVLKTENQNSLRSNLRQRGYKSMCISVSKLEINREPELSPRPEICGGAETPKRRDIRAVERIDSGNVSMIQEIKGFRHEVEPTLTAVRNVLHDSKV